MNEPVAILISSSDEGPRSELARQLGPMLARSVLSRAGRLVIISDVVSLLPMALLGAEARHSQELETVERRRARIVLVYQEGIGPELETGLLHQRMDENDQPQPTLLQELVSFEAIEALAAHDLRRETSELLEVEAVRAVFLIGDYGPLEPVVQAASEFGLRSRVSLYSVEGGTSIPSGWSPIAAEADHRPTPGDRPLEGDLKIARMADQEAGLAVRLEDLLDEVIRP